MYWIYNSFEKTKLGMEKDAWMDQFLCETTTRARAFSCFISRTDQSL